MQKTLYVTLHAVTTLLESPGLWLCKRLFLSCLKILSVIFEAAVQFLILPKAKVCCKYNMKSSWNYENWYWELLLHTAQQLIAQNSFVRNPIFIRVDLEQTPHIVFWRTKFYIVALRLGCKFFRHGLIPSSELKRWIEKNGGAWIYFKALG